MPPGEAAQFLHSAWPNQLFQMHGQEERLQAFTSLPFLGSLDALLNFWPHSVSVHLPDLADEASAIEVTSRHAKKCFDNKMSLLFNEVQRISPSLNQCLQEIKLTLGMPAMTHARCMVYATPDGKGTAAHFDQNVNFVFQLTGTKKWWLAPNREVASPTQRHTLGTAVDPELESYLDQPLPQLFPKEATSVILKPGSVLFIPQGYYHRTEAEGAALSLNFTFSQPNYVDLFTTALRSRLLLSPEWREYADGAGSLQTNTQEFAEEKLDLLLQELIQDLPNWKARDILGATEEKSIGNNAPN